MSKATLGRDVAPLLLKAMGLPHTACLSVDLEMPAAGPVTVVARFKLMPDALAAFSAALGGRGEPATPGQGYQPRECERTPSPGAE